MQNESTTVLQNDSTSLKNMEKSTKFSLEEPLEKIQKKSLYSLMSSTGSVTETILRLTLRADNPKMNYKRMFRKNP